MGSMEERMQILRMVEQRQITADEAAKLLAAMDGHSTAEANRNADQPQEGYRSRWLRILVTDKSGRQKLNVNIPFGVVQIAAEFGVKFAPKDLDMNGIDLNQLLAAFRSGIQGKLVEVEDEEKGQRIEIFAE